MRFSKYDQCRHGEPEDHCASCAACAACLGECGVCPYTPAPADHGAATTKTARNQEDA